MRFPFGAFAIVVNASSMVLRTGLHESNYVQHAIKLTVPARVHPHSAVLSARTTHRRRAGSHRKGISITAVSDVPGMSKECGCNYGGNAAQLQQVRSDAAHQRTQSSLDVLDSFVNSSYVLDRELRIV